MWDYSPLSNSNAEKSSWEHSQRPSNVGGRYTEKQKSSHSLDNTNFDTNVNPNNPPEKHCSVFRLHFNLPLNKECKDEPITSTAETRSLEKGEKGKSDRREEWPDKAGSAVTEGNSNMIWAMSCTLSTQSR